MITGVILARNEEANTLGCIEQLRPHVSEIILIDMESTDATVALARPHVDKILRHKLIGQFDAARNIAIPEATYDWLWFVDADERIPENVGRSVNNLIRDHGHEFEAISIPFKSCFCGRWMKHSGWWPGFTGPRVLKRGYFQWAEKLHGGVHFTGREFRFPPDPNLAVDHFSYRSIEHYITKTNRYTSTEAKQLAEKGTQWDWREGIHSMMHDLWWYYELYQGKLDEEHGWVLAWLSGQYRWLSHAKVLDERPPVRHDGEPAGIPATLDDVVHEVENALAKARANAPRLPLGIVLRGAVWNLSGYAAECRAFAKCLSRGDRQLQLQLTGEHPWRTEIDPADAALLRALQRSRRPAFSLAVTHAIPSGYVKPDAAASFNVLRTMTETDRVPQHWIEHVRDFDELWLPSQHSRDAFVRSGIAPEKIRVVPSCLDVDRFRPEGPRMEHPFTGSQRFVFLSVLDWQYRKGWDALLRAYCEEFDVDAGTALLLKTTTFHVRSWEDVVSQVEAQLEQLGTSVAQRPDIAVWQHNLSVDEVPALYRSVDAFVLASRGEGGGLPYLEAMACGIPVIGTRWSGNEEFMDDSKSLLVGGQLVPVPAEAVAQVPSFEGHYWFEPDATELREKMRLIVRDRQLRQHLAAKGSTDIAERYSLTAGLARFEEAISDIENQLGCEDAPPNSETDIIVEWEGTFFSGHSFSNINERLCSLLRNGPQFALKITSLAEQSVSRVAFGRFRHLLPFINRAVTREADVIVRHAFPPNWNPTGARRWVRIQPWEFGYLPKEWIAPLRDMVDEIWAPSHYVRAVYERSGIPGEKIHVIPWGVDPRWYHADAVPRLLPTEKSFRFLYVGGTIERKGFDRVLEAYLGEFRRDEDVALVVKDLGRHSFYFDGNFGSQIEELQRNASAPEIVYFDEDFTEGQLASLYRACHCLVAPYRGEGFGLPILEAMACGLPAIVPRGGPTDDFVTGDTGFLLPSRVVPTTHPWELCGNPEELDISIDDLRRVMRAAFEDQRTTRQLGDRAAQTVHRTWTWERTAAMMAARIRSLAGPGTFKRAPAEVAKSEQRQPALERGPTLGIAILVRNREKVLGACLARLRPFVDRIIVCDAGSTDRTAAVAVEYGAEVHAFTSDADISLVQQDVLATTACDWIAWIDPEDVVVEEDIRDLRERLSRDGAQVQYFQFRPGRSHLAPRNGHSRDEIPVFPTRPASSTSQSGDSSAAVLAIDHPFLEVFRTEFEPHLGDRSSTLHTLFQLLLQMDVNEYTIVETGCVRQLDDWTAGQSTILFDRFVNMCGGKLISVDISPQNCQHARSRCSQRTSIVNEDSIAFLAQFAAENPQSVHCLYLDSLDVDWGNPHPSALHHLKELCATAAALRKNALLVIDDHRDAVGRPGKSLYAAEYLERIGARKLFDGAQAGWRMP